MSLEQGLGKDLQELLANPSSEKKRALSDKISNYFSNDIFNEKESKIALDVIRMLTKDSEIIIRKVLSNNLKFTKNIPHDIIMSLAQDVDDVATPILEFSTVLSQENLVSIVKGCGQLAKLVAIAKRNDVSEKLSDALVDTDQLQVVETLVSNKDATISEETFAKTLDRFADSGVIMEAIVDRGGLPYVIVEKIMSKVSGDIKRKLVEKYSVSAQDADKVIEQTHEESVLAFLSNHADRSQIEQLAEHLFATGKLTSSIILRALCKGDLVFFEIALAKLANMKSDEIHKIIFEESVSSFSALYKKINMPKGTFDAVNVIVRFAIGETKGGTEKPTPNFSNRILERIIEGGYDQKVGMMKYFMVLLKSKVNSLEDFDSLQNTSDTGTEG